MFLGGILIAYEGFERTTIGMRNLMNQLEINHQISSTSPSDFHG